LSIDRIPLLCTCRPEAFRANLRRWNTKLRQAIRRRLDGPTRKQIVEKVIERMESTEPYEGKR
jgi:hypothetical protein